MPLHQEKSEARLEIPGKILTDPDMLSVFERQSREGVNMISHDQQLGESNNTYISNFDPSILTMYLTYLDANNCFVRAMAQPLPTGFNR